MSIRVTAMLMVLLSWGVPGGALGAGPVYWDWPADRAFSELELNGTALDQDGHLVTGLTARSLSLSGPEVFWRIVPDGQGGFYTGTGHGGKVYQGTAEGEQKLVAQIEGTEVFSLLVLPGGDLLAGCGPEGHLYRIDGAGESRLVGTVPGGYIWAMDQAEGSDVVWLATGSPAGLYRYDTGSGDLTEELSLSAENTLDVHLTADGALLLATQGPGLIYRHVPGKQPRLLFETTQDEARQFITGPEGETFLLALNAGDDQIPGMNGRATGAQPAPPAALLPLLGMDVRSEIAAAALYRVAEDGLVELWWSGHEELMTAAWSPQWGWLAGGQLAEEGGQATLYHLTPPSGLQTLARWAGGDILDILVPANPQDELLVSQAHPGRISALTGQGNGALVAISPPLDGGAPIKWGRLSWQGNGSAKSPQWSVRGGNRSQPDDSWTDWSGSWSEQDHELDLPVSRFLQWRVEFPEAPAKQAGWQVTQVSVSAWQENLAPVISEFQLEYLKDINLGGMLNGADNVTQRFRSGLQAEFNLNMQSDNRAGPDRSSTGRSIRVFTWLGTDPNGDRVSYRLEYRRTGDENWRSLSTRRPGVFETVETLTSWDTSEVPDGRYEMRLTATDRRDNPAHLARQTQRHLGPIWVDNTAPVVKNFAVQATETGFQLTCQVTDQASVLAGAYVVLPDGSVERVDPVDLICDSQVEKFAAQITWPQAGIPAGEKPWLVRFAVRDLGGNLSTTTGEIR